MMTVNIPKGWAKIRCGYDGVDWMDGHPAWGLLLSDGTIREMRGKPDPYAATAKDEMAILKVQKAERRGVDMNNDLMFSSKTDKWNTPKSLVDDLATVFNWDLDVCASGPNVCKYYYDESDNGLTIGWSGLCFNNPPYGRGIGAWYKKSYMESLENSRTVMLVPARTDTKYWHEYTPHASQVVFIKGRLKFGEATNSAPFPSAFVVFGALSNDQHEKLANYGISYR